MTVFLLNFISILIYGKFIKNKKVLVSILTLQMFLILALRCETLGVDLDNYSLYYAHYQNYSFKEMISAFRLIGRAEIVWGHESGYVLLNWVIGKLGFSFHSFLVIHAAICMSSIGIFIYKYSKNPAMSFAMFVGLQGFGYLFGILRQSLALAILLFSISALKERRFLRYLIIVVIAGLFHIVAYLALPLYFICKLKIKREHCIAAIILSIVIVLIVPSFIGDFLARIFSILSIEYSVQAFVWNNMFLVMVLFAILFAFFDYLITDDSVFACGFLYAILIQGLAFYVSIFSRAAIGIFLVFLYVLYPNCILKIKDNKERLIFNIVSYISLFIFYVYTMQSAEIVPYVSCFQ